MANEKRLSPATDDAIQELVDVERRRIDRDNRRTSLWEKSIEALDAQDRRQFEYVSSTRDADIGLRREQHAFLRRVTWAVIAFVAFLTVVLLAFALFGGEEQRALAADIVVPGLIGLAGYGVLTTLGRVVKAFSRDP